MLGRAAVLRRLAAIGAAYVSIYLRPLEADREGMLAPLRSLRWNLIDPKIALRALKPTGAG
jgi:hypothetical protein